MVSSNDFKTGMTIEYEDKIRKLIYTTNTLEGFNRQLRKITKTKTVFPNDDALLKCIYLAITNISKKWTSSYQNWGQTIAQGSKIK